MVATRRSRRRTVLFLIAGLVLPLLAWTVTTGSGEEPAHAAIPVSATSGEPAPEFGRSVASDTGHTAGFNVAPESAIVTYLGGDGDELSRGIATDPAGYIYVTGSSTSPNASGAGGASESSESAGSSPGAGQTGDVTDAFVAKLAPDGREVIYMTHLGGHGIDQGLAIAADAAGNAYVTGRTNSTDLQTVAPFQPSPAGSFDAFVAKLSPDGSRVLYLTYLGGEAYDDGLGIAVDAAGSAYVTGLTRSRDFPTRSPIQPALGGFADAFVAKLDPTGGELVYSTYLGGADVDNGLAIALGAGGEAYVTGRTRSVDFPLVRAIQSRFAGSFDDAFVARLNADGSSIIYSTYLGGSGEDDGRGIAVDPAGYAYVTGLTRSTDFPTVRPLQAARAEGIDAFVAKIDPSGTSLVYCTYLGGGAHDDGLGITVDAAGRAYLTGSTASSTFPLRSPLQPTHGGGFADAFLSVLSEDGSAIEFATYLGGAGYDYGSGVALDGRGSAFIAGLTRSPSFAPLDLHPMTRAGPSDVFVAKIPLPADLGGAVAREGVSVNQGRRDSVPAPGSHED